MRKIVHQLSIISVSAYTRQVQDLFIFASFKPLRRQNMQRHQRRTTISDIVPGICDQASGQTYLFLGFLIHTAYKCANYWAAYHMTNKIYSR